MKDRRTVDELSIAELEAILRVRKREERLRRLRGSDLPVDARAGQDIGSGTGPGRGARSTDHRRFEGTGATASYRARTVPDEEDAGDGPVWRNFPIHWDWVREKGLLVVEIGVVGALILVLLGSAATLRQVNRASSSAQVLPTATSTPPIYVVLPGGHTPPDSPGGAAPEEIPAHLRGLVSAVTPLPVPTPGPEQATRIEIPSIDVDAPVLEGDDWETLKHAAGHRVGTANPGERGNCVISAHNDIFGEIFRELPNAALGDEVVVHTASRVYRYEVSQKRIIQPTEVSVMEPTSSPVLTLISCYPYGIDTHRIVVVAELKP